MSEQIDREIAGLEKELAGLRRQKMVQHLRRRAVFVDFFFGNERDVVGDARAKRAE